MVFDFFALAVFQNISKKVLAARRKSGKYFSDAREIPEIFFLGKSVKHAPAK